MKKIVLVVLVTLFAFSCNSDKKHVEKKDSSIEDKKEKIKINEYPNFTIKITAKVLQDDKFRLLYTEALGELFSGKEIVFADVIGLEEFQVITFVLPQEDIYPVRLRLDFPNRNLDGIIIESIEMAHDDNKLFISSSELKKYFYPNDYIDYNFESGRINFINKEGKDYPYFVSREPLHEELMAF